MTRRASGSPPIGSSSWPPFVHPRRRPQRSAEQIAQVTERLAAWNAAKLAENKSAKPSGRPKPGENAPGPKFEAVDWRF
jgi:hypothetical protein